MVKCYMTGGGTPCHCCHCHFLTAQWTEGKQPDLLCCFYQPDPSKDVLQCALNPASVTCSSAGINAWHPLETWCPRETCHLNNSLNGRVFQHSSLVCACVYMLSLAGLTDPLCSSLREQDGSGEASCSSGC